MIQFTDLDVDLLGQVQFQGCNTSGICNGVDSGLLPKITAVPLTDGTAENIEGLIDAIK